MSRLRALVFIAVMANFSALMAQTEQEVVKPATDLQGIYQTMVNESHNYNNYEMIKEPVLTKFWKEVSDSVAAMKADIKSLSANKAQLEGEISKLNETITAQEGEIAALKTKIDGFTFIGIEMTKSSMAVLFWVVTVILVGVALFTIMLFFRANAVASTKVKNFNELQEEFQTYQQTMKERETTLRREFQTVQNKLWELEKKTK